MLNRIFGTHSGRRFAGLGLNRAIALPFHRLSASTASLHVARLRRFMTMLNPRQILPFAPRGRTSALGH
jgi:hypothetical protein